MTLIDLFKKKKLKKLLTFILTLFIKIQKNYLIIEQK
jgi:hypothetical protein